MALARVFSRAQLGVESPLVEVEVDIGSGLPHVAIVGLPATAVKESKDRVRSAVNNSGFHMPDGRITINLAPADLPKHGTRFDLPMALGIIAAMENFDRTRLAQFEFVGELALDGALRKTGGTLPSALRARDQNRALVVSCEDAHEAALVSDATVFGTNHLLGVCDHLTRVKTLKARPRPAVANNPAYALDLRDVRGQARARRALEIAAAGQHHLILCGSPGTGKTMLANRLNSILPLLTEDEALETAAVASVAKLPFNPANWRARPFRAPHHTASAPALIGGGSQPKPGEISLAHNGVLFLDELPEFDRRVLEALREPLETRHATVSRAEMKTDYPANFQLIAAMNPCPCGYFNDSGGRCRCSPDQVERYLARISGPLLDRLDLHVETTPRAGAQANASPAEDSATIRERINWARERQLARQQRTNGHLAPSQAAVHAQLGGAEERLVEAAVEKLGLSMRAHERILRVALTITDLLGHDRVEGEALTEALSYRSLDRRWR